LIGLSYLKNLQELDVSNNQLKVKFIEVLNH
jgi:Leucine-rich repeat (LRR) protein